MKCKKILKNNRQCQAFALRGQDFCFRHDPANKEATITASAKGGQNRALQGVYGASVMLERPEDVKRFLGEVINAVWAEGVPVQAGSSMGFLTRCWLDAYEASDVVRRLDEMDEKLNKVNP